MTAKKKNDLVTVDVSQLPATQMGGDKGFDEIAQGGDFLARLQLFSKGVAINKGLIKPGHWGIPEGDDVVTDLGISIDCLCLARRPKAIDMADTDAIVVNYDLDSDEFQRIAAASMTSDSGCMYGPSFLILERSSGRFVEFFCGTKSTRSEAKKIYPYLPLTAADTKARKLDAEPHGPQPFTMKTKLVERKHFSWHVPVVSKCSTPFAALPDMEKIIKEIEWFVNPQADGVEKVDEKTAGKKRAR